MKEYIEYDSEFYIGFALYFKVNIAKALPLMNEFIAYLDEKYDAYSNEFEVYGFYFHRFKLCDSPGVIMASDNSVMLLMELSGPALEDKEEIKRFAFDLMRRAK